MVVTYNATPTFSEKNNFNQIVFGEGAPLLEVELNEMQDIISDQFKRLGEGIFKRDGFVKLNSDFKTNGLLTVSGLAFLGEAIIRISNLSLTLVSGDTVYLAYKVTTVTPSSTIKEYGNQTSSTVVPNKLLDARIGEETSRRKQMTYTILKTNTDTSYSYIKLGTVSPVSGVLTFTLNSDAKVATVSDEMLNYISYLEKNFIVNSVQVVDARKLNGGLARTPRQYRELTIPTVSGGQVVYEFGNATTYGLTGKVVVVETTVGWSDTSGGQVVQRAYATEGVPKVSIRISTGLTNPTTDTEVWGSWEQEALISDITSAINDHSNNKSNPHAVTKAQVGLGSVENVGMATTAEAQAGTVTNKYMNPARVKEAIASLVPSATTSVAGKVQLFNGANSASTTLAPTANALKIVMDAVNTHTGDKANPHGVTTSQVNHLGNYVKKASDPQSAYPIGVSTMFVKAEDGDGWQSYGTVLTIRSFETGGSTLQIYSPYTDKMGGTSLQFRTWKYQATDWSPWESLETTTGAQDKVNVHANNKSNPHAVTKAQVGLGSVENYGVATQAEAQAGASNAKYVTPLRVKEAINALVPGMIPQDIEIASKLGKAITITDFSTFKPPSSTQGTVTPVKSANIPTGPWANTTSGFLVQSNESDSFHLMMFRSGGDGIAYRSYYQNVASAWTYLETTAGAQAKANAVNTALNTLNTTYNAHANNKSNPHAVTKAQVGLGSVENYGVATLAEAQAGLSNAKYMTPLRAIESMEANALARKGYIVSETTNFDTVVDPGMYAVQATSPFEASYNAPVGAYAYGNLTVLKSVSNGIAVTQIYTAHSTGQVYVRVGYGGTRWTAWNRLANSADITNALNSSVQKTGGTMTGALVNNHSVTATTFKTGTYEVKGNPLLGTLDFIYNI